MAGHKMTHAGCSIPGSASLCFAQPYLPLSLAHVILVDKCVPLQASHIQAKEKHAGSLYLQNSQNGKESGNLLDLGPFSLPWPPWARCPA